MNDLTGQSLQHEKSTLLLLRSSNNRITEELKTVKKEHNQIKESIGVAGDLVYKLVRVDKLKVEVGKLRDVNARINMIVNSLSTQIGANHEELITLRKVRERVQKEQREIAERRNEVVGLRSKVLPKARLRELKGKLAEESAGLENISEELGRLKEEVPTLIQKKESMKEELEQMVERIPQAREHIISLEERTERLSPKVAPEEEVRRLQEEVGALKPKKESLTEENRKMSPKKASIMGEDEKLTSILDAYTAKNKKARDRIQEMEKKIREMGVDKAKVEKLKEDVSSLEGGLEVKKKELPALKNEYTQLLNAKQGFEAVIKEVEEGTEQLKQMIEK